MRTSRAVLLFLLACGTAHDATAIGLADATPEPSPDAEPPTPSRDEDSLLERFPDKEAVPAESPRLTAHALPKDVPEKIDGYFDIHGTRRLHVQLDRPMYRPGDAVWVKTWEVKTRGLATEHQPFIQYELIDPRGQVVETKQVNHTDLGVAHNDFVLPEGAPGGKWTLKATAINGEVDERPFVVSSYTPPRIAKTLDFVREAYGPGDRVEAMVELTRPDGRPLANHPVRTLLQAAGEAVAEVSLVTDDTGAVFVAAGLPEGLSTSDGLLTVFVEEGGLTESISRSVPIVLADIQLDFFPEGGHLVDDLPGRVYFEAKNAHGEPADIQGYVTDDTGKRVADLESIHDGLGRFALTPASGRSYTAHITEPPGIQQTIDLPEARTAGCVLRSFDDTHSVSDKAAVAVRCAQPQDVLVAGVFREQAVDSAPVHAGPGQDTVVHLGMGSQTGAQGVLRVTLFDGDRNPLAERLVYRGAGQDLGIEVTADRDRYGPRDEVVLTVKTTDPSGTPVPAEVALSVVDDAVVQLADDEEGHMLTRLYLEPELRESPDDPAWYYDREERLAARGLDLVMGTKGYRSFEWVQVWNPPPPPPAPQAIVDMLRAVGYLGYMEGAMAVDEVAEVAVMAERRRAPRRQFLEKRPMAPVPMAAAPMGGAPVDMKPVEEAEPMAQPMPAMDAPEVADGIFMEEKELQIGVARNRDANKDIHMAGGEVAKREAFDMDDVAHGPRWNNGQWATVRVFPKPDYSAGFQGTRTDFRDTVHWEPVVKTNTMGEAELRFFLSDAITTFRVVAEGLGGGAAGHGEATLSSTLPVAVSTKLPPAVSAGDELLVPITVSNSRPGDLTAGVQATFDQQLLLADTTSGSLTLAPDATDTLWVPVSVAEGAGSATVRLDASGGGLSDSMEHTLTVVPPGFPRSFSAAGEMQQEVRLNVRVDDTVPGSLTANVTWQPSTVSTLVQGMDALIQTPGGCFEQTSSTNWPNVAILDYLEAHDGDPRLRQKSAKALDVGYQKLTGYQVQAGGFETWGSGPGKEVLSAFGLLQFADMADVYPVNKKILERDAKYLLNQRDGKGGFHNTGESAHGYGSAPKPILDGFITYALAKTGHTSKLKAEVAQQARVAERTDDPYVLALATRVLHAADHKGADNARDRLAELQAKDGSFPGAQSSITRSYEANLLVESTALAALALMDDPSMRKEADRSIEWLLGARRGVGSWGATQATALALDALTTHAELNKRPRTDGVMQVIVNGEVAGTLEYSADHQDALVLDGWEDVLVQGDNEVILRQLEGASMPFTVDVSWTSITPDSDPGAELTLSTELADDAVSMGDTVRLTTTLGNATDDVVPSPIARIGLPAGLEAQTWQLDELKERGVIAFYELRPREVTLYWDGIHADEQHRVALDLQALVPGRFTAPASTAYPYYDDDEPVWVAGSKVEIAP